MGEDSRIESILGDWQEQLDDGSAPDPEEVIAAHPELADRLRECFAVLLSMRIGEVAAPMPTLRPLAPDRYSVFRQVAKGGMGLVYWAIDNDLNREVAFKVIRAPGSGPERPAPDSPGEITPPSADTPASRAFETLKQRFLQEAWVTGGMAHPGIVPVYELGQTDAGVPYYTMRFIRGERTLADALEAAKDASLTLRLQLLEPFLKVCDAIQYAHAQRVIHRDLKPENIALGQFGEVVVLDWGLAKLQGQPGEALDPWHERLRAWRDDADLETLSAALGTPGYMAPEAVAGDIDAIDERSDVYSLGAILFRILTGRAVFEFDSFEDFARQVLNTEARDPRELAPAVPAALSRLCRAALARSREERPTGVETLAAGIRQWQVQSRVDRDVERWLEDAESRLAEAADLQGHAQVGALDRALVACGRILDARPDHERAHAISARAEVLRNAALEKRHRTARRRMLLRGAAALLLVGSIVAIVVASELDRRRKEAVGAREEAEQNLYRARIRGLVATSAEAEQFDPMRALLLAQSAVRQSDPPSASAISRLYAALTESHERARYDGHEAEVRSGVFAPEGDAILTASGDRTARIWPAAGGRPLVLEHEEPLKEARFSPDGRHVLTRTADTFHAYLWDRAGTRVARLEGHTATLASARFSPAGDRILTASHDGTARLFDLAGRAQVVFRGHTAAVPSAVFSPEGDRILTASLDRSVRSWDLSGNLLATFTRDAPVWEATFTPSGREILVSLGDFTSELWTRDGETLASYRGGRARMASNGDRVVTTLRWKQLCVHDRSGDLLATFHPPGGASVMYEFLPGEHRIAVACYDSTVRIWDPAGVRSTVRLAGHTGWTETLAFSPTGAGILTASRDRSVRIWAPDGSADVALRGHGGRIDRARFSPTGKHILTTARDGLARLWDAHGKQLLAVPYGSWSASAFSPAGDRFVVFTADHTAHVRDLAGHERATLRGHTAQVTSLVFAADGSEIVTASRDGTIRRWSATGRELAVIPGPRYRPLVAQLAPGAKRLLVTWVPPRPVQYVTGVGASLLDLDGKEVAEMGSKVRAAAFSPDGRRIVTGSYEGVIGIWDGQGKPLASWQGHGQSVLSCSFAPDGASVLTTSDDMTARVWDLEGRPLAVLRGHSGSVLGAAFDRSGRRILTGSVDKTARLWDRNGRLWATLRHDGDLTAAALSPDGATILTASSDGAARLWPVDTSALLDIAAARSTRSLTAVERERYVDLLGK